MKTIIILAIIGTGAVIDATRARIRKSQEAAAAVIVTYHQPNGAVIVKAL